MHRDLLIPPSSVPPACLVVCGVPPCDCWVRFPDLRISYPACAGLVDLIAMNTIVQGGLVDLIPMNAIVQGGLVDLIAMNVIVQRGLVDLIPMNVIVQGELVDLIPIYHCARGAG